MNLLKEWMEVCDYKITEGTDYNGGYGPDTYILDSWNLDIDGYQFSIVFNTKTHFVYEVSCYDFKNESTYRWRNPETANLSKQWHLTKNLPDDEAYDGVKYNECDTFEEWVKQATELYNKYN